MIEVTEVKAATCNHVGKAGVVWVFGLDVTHFVECVEAFVHPAMNALVRAENTVKPVVPYFVHNNYF